MEAVQGCRLRLYRTVVSALQDGCGDDRNYGKILSQLQALLDSEAMESGEEVSSATRDTFGTGENFNKLMEMELKRSHDAEEDARNKANRLQKENQKLSDEVEIAKNSAERVMEECRRFKKESKMNKAIISGLRKEGKAPDGDLCRKLQERTTKYKAEAVRLKQHLNISQEKITGMQKDYETLRKEESILREKLETAQAETRKLRSDLKDQKEAFVASEKLASEFKTTITRLGADAQEMFKIERKSKASAEKTQMEMVKWQHAAENAARIAEQAKEEMKLFEKQKKGMESEVELWKLRASSMGSETERIRNESKALAEISEERSLMLSWVEKSVLHPICEFSSTSMEASTNPLKKKLESRNPGASLASFELAKFAFENCQWVSQALNNLLESSKSDGAVLQEKEIVWREKYEASEEDWKFKFEKLGEKFKDCLEEKSLALEQAKAEEKKCGRLREEKRRLGAEVDNLKKDLSDLHSEIGSVQEEAEKKVECCSVAMTDAVKSASDAAFQKGLESGQQEIEKVRKEKHALEEKCQNLQEEVAELKRVGLHMQGEKVELDAEISAAREQVFQLSEDLSSIKSHWSESRAKLDEAINTKDAECMKMEERAQSLDMLLRECEARNQHLVMQSSEQQMVIERWEKGLRNSDARLEAIQRELEFVTAERNEYRTTFNQISGNLAEKEDFVRSAKSRLVCVEGLLDEKDFMLKRMSDQIQELNRALESKTIEAAANESDANEARECSEIAARAVESKATIIKEMRQKLEDLEIRHEEKLIACQESSRMELDNCQKKMRCQLEAAQIQLDVLRSQFSQMKQKVSALESDSCPGGESVEIGALDTTLVSNEAPDFDSVRPSH
ncbi:hypothetical protein BSKO_13565 [Bryopsis sp. KO-2023]|nr:hypothetical protein BSKO_13565 [Bryopsis sp. KO-2023]